MYKLGKYVTLLFITFFAMSCGDDSEDIFAVSAAFNANEAAINTGGSVTFSIASDLNVDNYQWTFEGGTPATSTAANPTVTYSTPGTYDVKLVVNSSNSEDELIKADFVTVNPSLKSLNVATDGYLAVADGGTLVDNATNFSFTTWIKTSSSSSIKLAALGLGRRGTKFFSANINGGKVNISTKATAASSDVFRVLTSTTNINDDAWHHIAITWDGSTLSYFIDGKLDTSTDAAPTVIRAFNVTDRIADALDGLVSETAFWSKALSASEIQTVMSTCHAGDESYLVALWDFTDPTTTGTKLIQGVGNGSYGGTLFNSTWSNTAPFECN